MTTLKSDRLPWLVVSAGLLASTLVAVPLSLGHRPDGSPALKVVRALADGDGGGDHDGGDHDGGHDGDHDGDHSASAEHGSSGGHDAGYDGDDAGYDDSSNDRHQGDDRNS